MAKAMQPAKSKAQAIRESIEHLQAEGREITTAAILALLPERGINGAKSTDIYYSTPWKELKAKEKASPPEAEASASTPEANAAPTEEAPENKRLSKGDAVRQALATLGKKAKPREVIALVKEQHGFDVSYQTVLNVKGAPKKKVSGMRLDRTARIEAETEPRSARPAAAGDISLEDIRMVRELAERLGVDKVQQLVKVLS